MTELNRILERSSLPPSRLGFLKWGLVVVIILRPWYLGHAGYKLQMVFEERL